MDNSVENFFESLADIAPANQTRLHPRTHSTNPEADDVRNYDLEWYNMSGKKILIILNQHEFKDTEHFKKKPSTRTGTKKDKGALKKTFKKLGFEVILLQDRDYESIIEELTKIADADHTRTSCICVAILTHGTTNGTICAADRPYSLNEVMSIFEEEESLVGKPKIYFVQACRGNKRDFGQTMRLGRKSDGVPDSLTSDIPSSWDSLEMDADYTANCDIQSDMVLTVPSHADTLVLYACIEGYISLRNKRNGTLMIQALCKQIRDNRKKKEEDIHRIITRINMKVSLKSSSSNKTKQTSEMRSNLKKLLKL